MEEATTKQLKFMAALGIDFDPTKFISKEDAKEAISDELVKREVKTEKIKLPPKSNGKGYNGGAMFTSYAKDVFCAIIADKDASVMDLDKVMAGCIQLVKQAKEAFE